MPSLLTRLGQLIPGFTPRPTPPALVVETPEARADRIIAEAKQALDRTRGRPAPSVDEKVPQSYFAGVNGKHWFLPYHHSATADTPEIRAAMRLMIRDAYVKAAWEPLCIAVESEEWQVQPSESGNADAEEQAEFVTANFNDYLKGGVPALVHAIIGQLGPDGFGLAEKVWAVAAKGKLEGKIVLEAAKAKDPDNLHVKGDSFGNVTHVTSTRKAGEEFPITDFLYSRYPGMFDEPLGMAAFRASYASYWMRDTVRKLRIMHTEKKMAGFLVGTYATDDEKAPLEAALRAAKSSTWAAVPEGVRIEALALSTASEPDYKSHEESLRDEIVTGIAFATLQTMTASVPGEGRGDSEVQKETSELAAWRLMSIVLQVVNEQLIPDLIDYNFPYPAAGGYPKLSFGAISKDEILKDQQVVQAAQQMGLQPSKKHYSKAWSVQLADPNDPDDMMQAGGMGGPPGGGMDPFGGGGGGGDPFGGQPDPFAFSERWESFAWQPYTGPEGGRGWTNGREVRYQEQPPDDDDGTGGGTDPNRQDIAPGIDKASRVLGGATVGFLTGSAVGGPLGAAVGTAAGAALGTDTARSVLGGIRALLNRGEEPEGIARKVTAGDPEATQAVRETASEQVRHAAGELAKLPPADPAEVRGGWAQASARMRAGDAAELGGHVETLATAREPGAIEAAFRGIGGVLGKLTGGALRLAMGAVKAFGRFAAGSGKPYLVWAASMATGAAVLFSPAVALGLGLISPVAAFALAPAAVAGAIGAGMYGRRVQRTAAAAQFAEWTPYTGPNGGRGWTDGTEVRYQVEKPGDGGESTPPPTRPARQQITVGGNKLTIEVGADGKGTVVEGPAHLIGKTLARQGAAKPAPAPPPTKVAPKPPAPAAPKEFDTPDAADAWGRANYGEWAKTLPKDELKAVGRYRFADYRPVNDVLRATGGDLSGAGLAKGTDRALVGSAGSRATTAEVREAVAKIDAALARQKTPEPITVHRGVTGAFAAGLKPGGEFTEYGYTSTSLSRDAADTYAAGETVMRIAVPAGTPGAYITALEANKGLEQEFLLPRNTRYRVTGESKEGATRVLTVQVMTDGGGPSPKAPPPSKPGGKKAAKPKGPPELAPALAAFHAAPEGSRVRLAIDNAIANASPAGHDATNPPKTLDPERVRRFRYDLASQHAELAAAGMLTFTDDAAFVKVMGQLGIKPLHAPGETKPFDPETMGLDGPTVSSGTPVRVARRGWVGLYGDPATGDDLTGKNWRRAKVERFAEGPADYTPAGPDGKRAVELLAAAKESGVNTLTAVADRAVRRLLMLPDPTKAATLFEDDELDKIAGSLAGSIAAADLLGRARVRRRAEMAERVATFAEKDDPGPPGPPPRPGLTWKRETQRWVRKGADHAKELGRRVKDAPKELHAKVKSYVRKKYATLEARYGAKGAKAIMAASVLMLPVPVPGASFLPIALAEAVRAVGKGIDRFAEGDVSDEMVQAVLEFLADLYADAGEEMPAIDPERVRAALERDEVDEDGAESFAEWTRYEGPEGGRGWKNAAGEVRYQEAMPGDDAGAPAMPVAPMPPPADVHGKPITPAEIDAARTDKDARDELLDRVSQEHRSALLAALHPGEVRPGYQAAEAVTKVFGETPPDEAAWRAIGCAPPDAFVAVTKAGTVGVQVVSHHAGVSAVRLLKREADGSVTCVNKSIAVKATGKGTGTALFAAQVDALAGAGVARIQTEAARDQGVNGYYTWPLLGYDGPLPADQRSALPPELAGAETIQQLYATPAGRAWWKKNGDTIKLTFDLAQGSRSRQVLAAYRAERATRTAAMSERPAPAGAAGDKEEIPLTAEEMAALERAWAKLTVGKVTAFAEQPSDPFHDFAEPVPAVEPQAAVDYFRRLVPTLADDPGRYGAMLGRHAFTLAVATEQTLLQKVKDAILTSLRAGTDATPDVQDLLDAAGVSPRNPQYAEMCVRTSQMDAYNSGATAEMQTPEMQDAFPCYEYLGVIDSRTGDDHRPLIGRYYPSSRDFADVRGPRVFNCRCSFRPVFKSEAADLIRAGKVERG